MKKGRGVDRSWEVRKYKADGAYYACCKCGWYYACGDIINHKTPDTWQLYNYCSRCGAHKKWYNTIPKKMNKEFPW